MIKTLLLITTLLACTLNAKNFSKQMLLGSWELSSARLNSTVAFGNYIGRERNEAIELLFNPRGLLKIVKNVKYYNQLIGK